MSSAFRVDPRIRALGKARIDITRRAKDEQEWQQQWREPRYPFPFTWSQSWKHAIQYKVYDFAAEIGFLIDVLGLPVYAFSPSYAMFTSPDHAFAFSVVAAQDGELGTDPDALRIQFMVGDLFHTAEELENRGILFEHRPQPVQPGGSFLYTSTFRTPHGICVDLLGMVFEPDQEFESASRGQQIAQQLEDLLGPDPLSEPEESPEEESVPQDMHFEEFEDEREDEEDFSFEEESPLSEANFYPEEPAQTKPSLVPKEDETGFRPWSGVIQADNSPDQDKNLPGTLLSGESKPKDPPRRTENLRRSDLHRGSSNPRRSSPSPWSGASRPNGGLNRLPNHRSGSVQRKSASKPADKSGNSRSPHRPDPPGLSSKPQPPKEQNPGKKALPTKPNQQAEDPFPLNFLDDLENEIVDETNEPEEDEQIKYEDLDEGGNPAGLEDFYS